jgi:hypothetical protein
VGGEVTLRLIPITLREANAYVKRHHRHHKPVRGCKFTLAVANGDEVCGVAIVGRPVARHLDDDWTAEVLRVCTDGTKNACSMLYGAAWRAARAMGYRRLVTYTLNTEPGVSLDAAGWQNVGECGGGKWHRERRPRVDEHPTQMKFRWEVTEARDGLEDPLSPRSGGDRR